MGLERPWVWRDSIVHTPGETNLAVRIQMKEFGNVDTYFSVPCHDCLIRKLAKISYSDWKWELRN